MPGTERSHAGQAGSFCGKYESRQVFRGATGLRTACCPEDEPVRYIVILILCGHL